MTRCCGTWERTGCWENQQEDESTYKCSATSQAKTTWLWREVQKTEAAGRGVCHKSATISRRPQEKIPIWIVISIGRYDASITVISVLEKYMRTGYSYSVQLRLKKKGSYVFNCICLLASLSAHANDNSKSWKRIMTKFLFRIRGTWLSNQPIRF